MGCLYSKKDASEAHTNIFRVVNIDENGLDLCSGQLEINDSDIILHRGSRGITVWPLHSLRRYGFEGEIFSFESGRRCETGEGIYAFRCRQAAALFRTLQQQIQIRNVIHDSVLYPVSRLTPSPQGRQTLQASVVHRSSIDNGLPDNIITIHNNGLPNSAALPMGRTVPQSPRSPSSADILEVMPLYPRPQSNAIVTNVYQVGEFKREHNNNQSEGATSDLTHVYSNDLNRDLALLRNTLKEEAAFNTMRDIEDETRFLESRYINDLKNNQISPILSPTISNSSEHYAQLSLDQQESSRLYVNLVPDKNIVAADANKNEPQPITPLTPKQAEYCNLSIGGKPELNTYANLSLGDLTESLKSSKFVFNIPAEQKFSESDTVTSMSPVEDLEVNYAVLDIDSTKDTFKGTKDILSPESHSNKSSINESTSSYPPPIRGRLVSQTSMEKSLPLVTGVAVAPALNVGYTTIDFDKTVALTSVAAGTDVDLDGARKTRHTASNLTNNSPSNSDKSKTIIN